MNLFVVICINVVIDFGGDINFSKFFKIKLKFLLVYSKKKF